jgi:Calcineurin-like phosphoesterase
MASSTANVSLPFGSINVVALTDVHSWVGGHKFKEPRRLDADYGAVLSFLQRLRQHAVENSLPLFFVTNGDWIDGTALAMNGDASHLVPLLEKMGLWDALNVGNHELYRNEVIDYMSRPGGYVEWWGSRLLSSNVLHASNKQPIGNRYRVLTSAGKSVLAFGFLYDMTNQGDHVLVASVQATVEEAWFKAALKNERYDAILVLAHMGADDPLIKVILHKIRDVVDDGGDVPVQFIAGHTHRRQLERPGPASSAAEFGRFLDTVGFAAFPTREAYRATNETQRSGLFRQVFLDANVGVLEQVLGVDALMTDEGQDLSNFIDKTQEEMGLHDVVGCLRGSYYLENRTTTDRDSLWRFFAEKVVPTQFEADAVVIMGQAYWRYDLLGGGDMRLDDIAAVSPFNESFVSWEGVPGEVVSAVNQTLNAANSSYLPLLPNYVLSSAEPFQESRPYRLVTNRYEAGAVQDALLAINANVGDAKHMNLTTTQVWVDYFVQYREGCTPSKTSPKYKGSANGQWHNPLEGYDVSGKELNVLLVVLAVLAVLLVAAVAAAYVRMRGAIWKRHVERQEYATMDAIRERREMDGDEEEDDNELI